MVTSNRRFQNVTLILANGLIRLINEKNLNNNITTECSVTSDKIYKSDGSFFMEIPWVQ